MFQESQQQLQESQSQSPFLKPEEIEQYVEMHVSPIQSQKSIFYDEIPGRSILPVPRNQQDGDTVMVDQNTDLTEILTHDGLSKVEQIQQTTMESHQVDLQRNSPRFQVKKPLKNKILEMQL